ncbi:hypothetical protein SLEP1_g12540 [Rubroshorea leprosula]|uniref:Uncharacterized protein n=1 Tax=Rubroshorea leprosula TaxID=152421 RepID=A0AAV5IM17_9ROSI|nr:hypothetical protein SLEP1_g12540 [Rubroshorea leprosula]
MLRWRPLEVGEVKEEKKKWHNAACLQCSLACDRLFSVLSNLRCRHPKGPSSIKWWKDKFFFADDIEWGRTNIEVEALCKWKMKKANPKKDKLSEDKEEEVKKLIRVGKEVVDINHLLSLEMINAAEIYGKSLLNGEEMNHLLSGVGNITLLKKSRALVVVEVTSLSMEPTWRGIEEGVVA